MSQSQEHSESIFAFGKTVKKTNPSAPIIPEESFCWSDDEMGYQNFLKINKTMPNTSTEKIVEDPPNSLNRRIANDSDSSDELDTSIQKKLSEPTVERNYKLLKKHDEKFEKLQKTCDTIVSNQRSIMRELVLLRHKYSKETNNMEDNENILNIPTKSTQELIDLEDKIRKDPHSEKCLKTTFDVNINDLTKYIRCNLKKVMLDEVTANFSWFGHQKNVSIKNYLIIKILKDFALQHFKNSNNEEVIQIIKRWFQFAKDRIRKRPKSN